MRVDNAKRYSLLESGEIVRSMADPEVSDRHIRRTIKAAIKGHSPRLTQIGLKGRFLGWLVDYFRTYYRSPKTTLVPFGDWLESNKHRRPTLEDVTRPGSAVVVAKNTQDHPILAPARADLEEQIADLRNEVADLRRAIESQSATTQPRLTYHPKTREYVRSAIRQFARTRGGSYDAVYASVYRLWWMYRPEPEPESWFEVKAQGESYLQWFEENEHLDELAKVLPSFLAELSRQIPIQQELGL